MDLVRLHEHKAPSNILREFEHSCVKLRLFFVSNGDVPAYFLALHPIGQLRSVNDSFQASSSGGRVTGSGRQ
jgi:hypothetical protein